MDDSDLFTSPGPAFSYELDLCSLKDATERLFDGLVNEIISVLTNELHLEGLPFDMAEITDPIIIQARSTLNNLTDQVLNGLDQDCTVGRRLQEGSSNSTSLVTKIQNALESIEGDLREAGITLEFNATPVFDR